jgi:hypothetical protein
MAKGKGKMKPAIFSTPMVEAILNTQPETWPPEPIDQQLPCKGMTRRVAKFKMKDGRNPDFSGYSVGEYFTGIKDSGMVLYSRRGDGVWETVSERLFPKYKIGDQLWVREKFQLYPIQEFLSKGGEMKPYEKIPKQKPESYYVEYAAGQESHRKWRSPLFMPQWASRLFLEVKNVRIEKVRNITPYDVLNEGIYIEPPAGCDPPPPHGWEVMSEAQKEKYLHDNARPIYIARLDYEESLINEYSKLWDTLNAKRGYPWESNPYVFIYEFMRLDADAVKGRVA